MLLAQVDVLQWADKLGYPIAMGIAMAWALWKVLSELAASHIKFVETMGIVATSQAESLVAITAEHKLLLGQLTTLAETMTNLAKTMQEMEHPKSA